MKRQPQHIITFIAHAMDFIDIHAGSGSMNVDKDNCVDDLDIDSIYCPNGVIAGIENDLGELVDWLYGYYEKTNNKAAIKRLDKIKAIYRSN